MSEVFIEKIVNKKKTSVDILITVCIILAALLLITIIMFLGISNSFAILGSIWFFLDCAVIFGAYYVIKSRNLEFEYLVTNNYIDIDKIVAKSRRKRIFSGDCKNFEMVAKVKSDYFQREAVAIKDRIDASGDMNAEDAYFIKTVYKNKMTIVIFQPDERILKTFRMFIPRIVLN